MLLVAGLRVREALLRGRDRGLEIGRVELREGLAEAHGLPLVTKIWAIFPPLLNARRACPCA